MISSIYFTGNHIFLRGWEAREGTEADVGRVNFRNVNDILYGIATNAMIKLYCQAGREGGMQGERG